MTQFYASTAEALREYNRCSPAPARDEDDDDDHKEDEENPPPGGGG